MNPRINDGGLSLSLQALSFIRDRATGRDNRPHDIGPLEAGPTFLPDKAISYQNPYVAKVQAVAPRFQGVPKLHTYSITGGEKRKMPCTLSFLPAMNGRGFLKGVFCEIPLRALCMRVYDVTQVPACSFIQVEQVFSCGSNR